jgi:hypothetical protein
MCVVSAKPLSVWALNGRFPLRPFPEKVAVAREVVLRLYQRGDVELWRGLWPEGATERLGPEAVKALTVEDLAWHDPEHTGTLGVIRTRTVLTEPPWAPNSSTALAPFALNPVDCALPRCDAPPRRGRAVDRKQGASYSTQRFRHFVSCAATSSTDRMY